MVVLNTSKCKCLDVVTYKGMSEFLEDASEVLTKFVTFARGEKMIFPIPFLMHRLKHKYTKEIESGNIKFVVKIEETESYNFFSMEIATIESNKIVNITNVDKTGFLTEFSLFNAIPLNRNRKEDLNASKKESN